MNSSQAKENFESFLKQKAEFYFREVSTLNEAVLYSLLAPGKRVRPLLCMGFSQGFSGKSELAKCSGMSVEMIHAYSLIHDDLPAMDNDDYRRGRPTNHKVYGEATAILAGDALLTFAPEFLLKELKSLDHDPFLTVDLVTALLQSCGHDGMVKGQALDMKFETEDLSAYSHSTLEDILKTIHCHKTGAIITWSCVAGLYSRADAKFIQENLSAVTAVGQKIGLLFQMVDDILDVTATIEELGKTPGKDEKAGKLTYTQLYGLKGARLQALELVRSIHADLATWATVGDWTIIHEVVSALEEKAKT